jgi:hypothetical protein
VTWAFAPPGASSGTRWALLKDPERLKDFQLAVLWELRRSRSVLYRRWQLNYGLPNLYRLADPALAPAHLDWWLTWACRCRILCCGGTAVDPSLQGRSSGRPFAHEGLRKTLSRRMSGITR